MLGGLRRAEGLVTGISTWKIRKATQFYEQVWAGLFGSSGLALKQSEVGKNLLSLSGRECIQDIWLCPGSESWGAGF